MVAENDLSPSFDDLADVLPNILGYLTLKEIMCKRRLNKKTKEAAKKTTVPPPDFRVHSVDEYNGMVVMAEAMPNLQQITISYPGDGHKYNDGEDPDEDYAARTAGRTSLDIEIISNFRKLRILDLFYAELNGRYPFLFNSFPMLQKLSIRSCRYLKWDLEMLAGLPLLKELECGYNSPLTGNVSTLRVFKATLQKVDLHGCRQVEGNFMDLADFPHLKVLNLYGSAVTGDIRDIGENDFSLLEYLRLPEGVYGGSGYEFQRISDGPDVARAVYLLIKQRPGLKMEVNLV